MTQMTEENQTLMEIKSPCVQICKIVNRFCIGCGRTGKEITQWSKYTHQERDDIMSQLQERMYSV